MLPSLGKSYAITKYTINHIEVFVFAMCVNPRIKPVEEVPLIKLEGMIKGISRTMLKFAKFHLSRIPLYHHCLIYHIIRVNYPLAHWKQVNVPFVPLSSPTDHGHLPQSEEHLESVWSKGPILSDTLLDIVTDQNVYTQEPSEVHKHIHEKKRKMMTIMNQTLI